MAGLAALVGHLLEFFQAKLDRLEKGLIGHVQLSVAVEQTLEGIPLNGIELSNVVGMPNVHLTNEFEGVFQVIPSRFPLPQPEIGNSKIVPGAAFAERVAGFLRQGPGALKRLDGRSVLIFHDLDIANVQPGISLPYFIADFSRGLGRLERVGEGFIMIAKMKMSRSQVEKGEGEIYAFANLTGHAQSQFAVDEGPLRLSCAQIGVGAGEISGK